ncbi:hypothetical protein [Mycolicibacterium sphagni]|uniref:hypothetical protein n=1 Tax=Mycolicibacterium sphagni TaxID=1786 RepID=UPI0021F3389E|nr:hypothetical protein [Mycolicibacterium sphagni]MCV7174956.1 hypothetical protein [Mycolicibacterium sphagni]
MSETDEPFDGLPAVTAAELKSMREYIGLDVSWVAKKLAIGERRITRMEAGGESIVFAVVELLDEAHADAKALVDKLVAFHRRAVKRTGCDSMLTTYRNDEQAAEAGFRWPARWHRHVAARVADAAPGVVLIYPDTPASPPVRATD